MGETAAKEARANGSADVQGSVHPEVLPTLEPAVQEFAGFEVRLVRKPGDVLEDARAAAVKLREFLDKTDAVQKYGDREHVMNEGWQFVAAMFGTTARAVGEPSHVEFGGDHGFRASCELVQIATGKVLARATALCMTDEPLWKTRPKYKWVEGKEGFHKEPDGVEPVTHQSRSSMAQTRASSKSMAMVFRWIVLVAGYSPTPAEEMGSVPVSGEKSPGGRERADVARGAGSRPGGPTSTKKPAAGDAVITEKRAGLLWARFKASRKTRETLGKILGCKEDAVWAAVKLVKVKNFERVLKEIGGE